MYVDQFWTDPSLHIQNQLLFSTGELVVDNSSKFRTFPWRTLPYPSHLWTSNNASVLENKIPKGML